MKIQVPSNIKEATKSLGDLDDLITAKEWQRAAIIWAFTEEKQGRRSDLARKGAKLTLTDFAKLGIHGLTKRDTVAAYRSNWEWAMINHGAADVQPGQRVDLPDVEWPGRQDDEGQKRYVNQDPGAIARAMGRGKVDAETFAQDIDADTAAAIVGRIAEDRPAIVADAVAQSGGAARAVARNTKAVKAIENEIVTPAPLPTTNQMRQANPDLGPTLAVHHLRDAVADLINAVFCAEKWGVDDEDAEKEALTNLHHYLRVYEGKAQWTDADYEVAADMGVDIG